MPGLPIQIYAMRATELAELNLAGLLTIHQIDDRNRIASLSRSLQQHGTIVRRIGIAAIVGNYKLMGMFSNGHTCEMLACRSVETKRAFGLLENKIC